VLAASCSSVLFVSAQTLAPAQPGSADLVPARVAGQRPVPEGVAPYVISQPIAAPARTMYLNDTVYSIAGSQSHEEMNLANQATQLVQQLGAAKSDTDRDKLKTQLNTILEKQFELRQQRHKKEIEALEAQIKKLRDLVDKRQENRREIIAKRMDQILQESQG